MWKENGVQRRGHRLRATNMVPDDMVTDIIRFDMTAMRTQNISQIQRKMSAGGGEGERIAKDVTETETMKMRTGIEEKVKIQ